MVSGSAFIGRRLLIAHNRPTVVLASSFRALSTAKSSKKSGTKVGNKKKRTPITESATKFEKVLAVKKKEIGSTKGSPKRSHKKAKTKASPVLHPNDPEILIPGATADSDGTNDLSSLCRTSPYYHSQSHGYGGGGSYRLTKILPAINVSALLNPKDYIKKSATPGGTVTISGADAARRLLRGRQALLDVLNHELFDQPRNKRKPPKPYALMGHGVPQQLLQDHINMADSILTYHDHAAECSFTNFHGDLSFNWVRIRSRNGENRACQWPPPAAATEHPEWEYQMELYMTVMNRLASNLGMALRRGLPSSAAASFENDDEDDDFVTRVDSFAETTPRYWSVELLRGMAYPPHLLPDHVDMEPLTPIVEWTPREGISAPGHVCIRLQGTSKAVPDPEASTLRRKRKVPVTLVFDACFRNNLPV